MLAIWLAMALACSTPEPPPPPTYTVVRGDTLFVIARDHGVTVDELRAWNTLDGDRIEIGQALILREHDPAASSVPSAPHRKRARSTATASQPAATPAAKRCLPPPSEELLGEAGAFASVGLDRAQVRRGLDAALPATLPCAEGGTGVVLFDLTIGCNGLVTAISVDSAGPFSAEATACMARALRSASFDAHQLPNGMKVGYPLTFE